ncbi:MAG: DUF2971 domain-containing protein [Cyclobacteriaceae bacterium]
MKKVIYKFFRINQYLFDTLISNQLYFSSIQQFNDPYDSRMTFLSRIDEEDFKVYLKNTIESEEIRLKYLNAFKKNPDEFIKPFIDLYESMLNYFGICCFTNDKDDLLLWSHYADGHKGVCLGFDYDLMTKKFPQFDEVDYNDDPFHFDIKNATKSVSNTILRKSTKWKYEGEIRFLMERSKRAAFYLDALAEVNFGSKCKPRDMLNIQYLVTKLGYKNCQFYKAGVNKKEFKIDFEKSNLSELKDSVLNESKAIPFKGKIDLKHLL